MTESRTDGNYYIFRLPLKPMPDATLTVAGDRGWLWVWLNDPQEDIYTEEDGEPL